MRWVICVRAQISLNLPFLSSLFRNFSSASDARSGGIAGPRRAMPDVSALLFIPLSLEYGLFSPSGPISDHICQLLVSFG